MIPPMPRALVIGPVPGRPWLVRRTLRSLRAVGITDDAVSVADGPQGAGLARAGKQGLLVIAAGTWLRHPDRFRLPPVADGCFPIAIGLPPRDPLHGPWTTAQGQFGGNYPDRNRLPPPACEWLPPDAVADPAPRRAVHWPPLDWQHDPGLRLLEVVTSLHHGGAEKVAWTLARRLPASGTAARLVVLGKPMRGTLPSPPGTVDLSALPHTDRIPALAKVAAAFGADAIHAHLLGADDLRALAALGWPVIAAVHNTRAGWMEGTDSLRPDDCPLLAACARAVEDDLRESLPGLPVRTVWNGIETAAAGPTRPSADGPVLVCVANPRPQKRLERLPGIVAATRRELCERGRPHDVRLVVAGELPASGGEAHTCYTAFLKEVDAHDLADSVRFTHGREEVPDLLAQAHALVSCSAHEGLSLAHLEALAAGLPVVAADAGGTRELAWRNPALRLVPADAGPATYATALADLLEKPPATGPQAVARDFHADAMARRVAWLARSVAAFRSGPGEALWFVTNNLATGGAQSSLRRLLKCLHQRGVRVRAAVLMEGPDAETPGSLDLTEAGIQIAAPPPAGEGDATPTVTALLEAMASDPPRAVFLWNALPPAKLLLADALVSIPVFDVSPGEMMFVSLERYFADPLPALPYRSPADYGRLLAGVVVKYSAEAERAAAALGARTYVVPNGIGIPDQPAGPCSSDGRLVIGTVARLSPQKRLGDLIEAFSLALPRLPGCVLRVAGEIEAATAAYADDLRAQAAGLPVEWCGQIDDMAAFHASLDMLAMVSEPAGCPNASLEAMAAGVPVVATDWGGAREQIIDRQTGLLVPPRDPHALADALVRLGSDRSLRRALGAAGRRHVAAHFPLERMADAYLRLLR